MTGSSDNRPVRGDRSVAEARTERPPSAAGRKRLRGIIQIAISTVLLAVVLRQVHWTQVRDAILHIEIGWLAFAWALFLLGVAVRAGRWRVLLDALGVHRPLGELTVWYFVGSFFNVILPTGFGGDVVRAAELSQDTHRPGAVVNSIVVDRYFGIVVLLAMGIVAGFLAPDSAPHGVLWFTEVLFVACLLAAWLLRRNWWGRLSQRPDAIGRIVSMLHLPDLAEAVAPYDRRTIGTALAISLVFNVVQIGWNMAIGRGLGLYLPVSTYLIFVPLTALALLLPSFGGLGVRELTYAGLFGNIGVPQATAIALSLGVYIITVASGLVGGVLYLIQGIRRVSRQRAAQG